LLPTIIARIRRMFDLSAEPTAIASALSSDPHLVPLVSARPGLRVPGAWDPFEIAVRAVLGQQITVKAATLMAGRIVAAIGTSVTDSVEIPGLDTRFPKARTIQAQGPDRPGNDRRPRDGHRGSCRGGGGRCTPV